MRKLFLTPLIVTVLFMGSSVSLASEDTNQIKEGAEIILGSFHKQTETFQITIKDEPAIGPNYAKVRDVAEAVEIEGGQEGLKKRLPKLMGTTLTLKKPLKLLSDQELEKAGLN